MTDKRFQPHEGVNIFKTAEEVEMELDLYSGGRMSKDTRGIIARQLVHTIAKGNPGAVTHEMVRAAYDRWRAGPQN